MNPTLFGGHPATEPANMKKKPRGRPFAKGTDPRRRQEIVAVGANQPCPSCIADGRSPGTMTPKIGQFGRFLGCSSYPTCRYTERLKGNGAFNPTAPHTVLAPDPANEPTEPTAPIAQEPDPMLAAPLPTTSAPGSLDALVAQIARAAAADTVNEKRVREIVTEANAGLRNDLIDRVIEIVEKHASKPAAPTHFNVSVNAGATVTVEGTAHAALKRVLTLTVARFNVLLVGPAGSGKTTLGEQVSKALGLPFATLSCAPGLPESALIGRMIPNLTTGTENYRAAPFVNCYRDGGIFLLDEVDNADASTLLILNSALANGHLTLPTGERIDRHPDFVLIASANTYGHGQSREYVGRTQLDAAFLDRFVGATVTLDYDTDLEARLCPESDIIERVHAIRSSARALKLRRVVSTRGLMSVRKLVTVCGDTLETALLALTEGWSAEDRRACGVEA